MQLSPTRLLLLPAFTTAFTIAHVSNAQNFLEVSNYGASGSNHYGHCSTTAGSKVLIGCTTDGSYDFVAGQGIRIVGGGSPTLSSAPAAPSVSATIVDSNAVNGLAKTTTRCYVVSAADPLEGISTPSPATCIQNQPSTLSYFTIYNNLNIPCNYAGPDPAFLWYVSVNNNDGKGPSPYTLLSVSGFGSGQGCGFSAYAQDLGQQSKIGDRGGWPVTTTTGNIGKNEDFYTTIASINGQQVTVADALPQTQQNLLINHDDTLAVQAAINDAISQGGADIQFEAGNYNLFRPVFHQNGGSAWTFGRYPVVDPKDNNDQSYSEYDYLQIPTGNKAGIVIAGRNSNGSVSVINTPPDHGGWSHLLALGDFGRPSYGGAPAYPNPTVRTAPVNKGDKQVTLVGQQSFKAGDDIWLYSGSFQGGCQDVNNGTGGGNCHYSELNTVSSVSSDANGNTVLALTYPASKSYFATKYIDPDTQAATSNSYGIVRMPPTPHGVTLENAQINTYNPILSGGMVYGLLISGITDPYPINYGPFGNGFKRDVTIQDSTWSFGRGDVTFNASDEYDQFTNVTFNSNVINGFAAPGAEGPFLTARILVTEGSSQIHFSNNQFNNASINVDVNTDDSITNNQFKNGIVTIGSNYQTSGNCYWSSFNQYDPMFGPKANLDIESNTFTIDNTFAPPFVLQAGSSTGEKVLNNTINYSGVRQLAGFNLSSGTISGNVITFSNSTYNFGYSGGFCVSPSQQPSTSQFPQQPPAYPIKLTGNTINYPSNTLQYGITLPNPGTAPTSPVCVGTNTYNFNGPQFVNPGNVPQNCTQ